MTIIFLPLALIILLDAFSNKTVALTTALLLSSLSNFSCNEPQVPKSFQSKVAGKTYTFSAFSRIA